MFEARSWDYCFMQARFPFLSFLPMYIVRSPCFILSPQSSFLYVVRVLYPVRSPQSAVRSPQSIFKTDRIQIYAIVDIGQAVTLIYNR